MNNENKSQSLLRWLPVGVLCLILVCAAVWASNAMKGSALPSGPKIAVRPGMVDFVKEAQSGSVTRERQDPDDEQEGKARHDSDDAKRATNKSEKGETNESERNSSAGTKRRDPDGD